MAEWSKEDSEAALLEGWDIFDSHGSLNGPYQISTLEEPGLLEWLGYTEKKFEDDTDVWNVVGLEKTPLHQRAMAFIREMNLREHDAIQAWLRNSEEDKLHRCTATDRTLDVIEEALDTMYSFRHDNEQRYEEYKAVLGIVKGWR